MIEVEIDKDIYLDCYQHIVDDDEDIDIEFLYGGRDSGKSRFIGDRLTEKCLASNYFRCILIKETHESIKDSQWQLIKDTAEEEWNVGFLFKFTVSPLGINCANNNKFIARGMNEPGRIKSINNPSDAWVEEGNQISKDGFITLLTSLRVDDKKGRVKLWFSFNPEADTADFKDFWLFDMFFKDHYPHELSFVDTFVMKLPAIINTKNPALSKPEREVKLKYRVTHTTYHDNPYCTPQRQAIHESLKIYDPYRYNVFTLGLWGNKEIEGLFAWAYSRKKHVGRCKWNPAQYTYLSFDFNKNPICCSVFQWQEKTINVVECIKLPNSNIYTLCDHIKIKYKNAIFIVTGDATGQNSSALVKDDINYYIVIKNKLNLKWPQIKVPSINPSLEENQVLVNVILNDFNWIIDEENAKGVIYDMENVRMLPTGKIDKTDREDPKKQADAMDTVRYFLNMFLRWYLKQVGLE